MDWKIKRDPYYSELYEQFGHDYITRAGFMYDNSTDNYNIEESLDIMCTPLNFIKDNLVGKARPCILLTTGSFNPVHSGHIESMQLTKEKMESFGWNVVGGFIAPDHDEYINFKLKDEAIPFPERMNIILEELRGLNIDWITVDPWAGIFQNVAVNFTDIINRLDLYVSKHLGVRIPIVYVCGGDNARFANTFLNRGYCAVTTRPGYHTDLEIKPRMEGRVFIVENGNDSSSTKIRKEKKWKAKEKKAFVRTSMFAVDLEKKLCDLICSNFEKSEVLMYEIQSEKLQYKDTIINLDPMTSDCEFNLRISREYDLFGIKRLGFVNRPGQPSIDRQIEEIKDKGGKVYVLHDDDIFSGSTMKYASSLLEDAGIIITDHQSYIKSNDDEEVIDVRDFIFDQNVGGLVVRQLDGSDVRVPYIYPFVCPYVRSSINNPLQFSIDVWNLNAENYAHNGNVEMYDKCVEYRDLLTDFIN